MKYKGAVIAAFSDSTALSLWLAMPSRQNQATERVKLPMIGS
ncbi:hypothetical protein [Lentilactobacillus parakefiri]